MKTDDSFAVVIETPNNRTISTIYKKEGTWADHASKIQERHENAQIIPNINDAAARLAASLGYPSISVFICEERRRTPLSEIKEMYVEDRNFISHMLETFSEEIDNAP